MKHCNLGTGNNNNELHKQQLEQQQMYIHHLLHAGDVYRWRLVYLEDGESSSDVIFVHLELGHLGPHVSYELHGLRDADGICEGPVAAEVFQQDGHGLLELLRRVKQA